MPAFSAEIAMLVQIGALLLVLLMAIALALVWRESRRWKASARALAHEEERYRAYARMSSHWYWEQDEYFRFTWVSPEIFDKAGIRAESYIGRTRWEMLTETPDEVLSAHKVVLEAHQPFQDFECAISSPEGIRHFSISGEPFFDEQSNFKGYRGTAKDITDRWRMEETVRRMAQYDGLTGLPNRALFFDHLRKALALAQRNNRQLAILYFDLDRFKPVNDKWGHHAGDALLKAVAERALGTVRKSDTVARLGGDEFAVLLQEIAARANADKVADKIRYSLAQPFTLEGIPEAICVGASVGIALFPQDGENADDLVQKADGAMYTRKKAGLAAGAMAESR